MQSSIRGTILVAIFVLLLAFSIPSLRSIFAAELPLATPWPTRGPIAALTPLPSPSPEPTSIAVAASEAVDFEAYRERVDRYCWTNQFFLEYLQAVLKRDCDVDRPGDWCKGGVSAVTIAWELNGDALGNLKPPSGFEGTHQRLVVFGEEFLLFSRSLVSGLGLDKDGTEHDQEQFRLASELLVGVQVSWARLRPELAAMLDLEDLPDMGLGQNEETAPQELGA